MGRLSALLPVSIASLLALDCSATSIRFAAAAAGNNLTQAQKFLKADQESQEDFVRRCEVVVTVSDDSFLPVKPLDRFCQTTDAAMECRMKVGQRLKETHARDGDMGKFCGAVYDWFQGKYGMKCPQQCRKLQCKSTCMWLDAKKKIVKEDAAIKSNMMAAESALKAIKAVSNQVKDKVVEWKSHNFTIKMQNVKLQRAEKNLAEEKVELNATSTKKAKVDAAADKLEKTIAATQDNLVKRDDSVMKQKFRIDKARLKLEAIAREAKRELDRAKEDREEEVSLKAEAGKLGSEIAGLNTQKAALNKTLAADQKEAAAAKAVLAEKIAKLQKAYKQLEPYKVQNLLSLKPKHGIKQEEFYFTQGQGLPDFDAVAPAVTKVVSQVNFPRTSEAWKDFFWKDNFAVRWTGMVLIKEAGDYTFSISSDDGSKLFVDGETVADADGAHEMQEQTGIVTLSAGQHDIRLQYFEKKGDAGMVLKYQGADTDDEMVVVPAEALQEAPAVAAKDGKVAVSGLTEELFYFTQGPKISMVTKKIPDITLTAETVNMLESSENWPGSITNEDFAARFSGFLLVEKEGKYDFSLTSDDGSMLYLDNEVVVNNDGLHNMREKRGKRMLSAGRHAIMLDYYQSVGKSGLILKYQGADSDNQMVVVPRNRLQASRGAAAGSKSPATLVTLVQEDLAAEGPWEVEYKQVMSGTAYTNNPMVADIKELVNNQFKRASAVDKLLADILKKVKDGETEIKELDLDVVRLSKDKKRAEDSAASAKGKADDLEKKAKARNSAADMFKAANVTQPLGELKKAKAARAKEKAGLEKAKKTLIHMQGLQKDQNQKFSAAKSAVGTAEMGLTAAIGNLKSAKAALAETLLKKADLEKLEKNKKAALSKNEQVLMKRLKAYKIANRDLEQHKPEIVKQHNLKPDEF